MRAKTLCLIFISSLFIISIDVNSQLTATEIPKFKRPTQQKIHVPMVIGSAFWEIRKAALESRYEYGLTLANKADENWPNKEFIIELRVFFLVNLGRYDEAEKDCEWIIKNSSHRGIRSQGYRYLSIIELNRGNIDKALDYSITANEINSDITAKGSLANVLSIKGEYEAAIKLYEQILREFPKIRYDIDFAQYKSLLRHQCDLALCMLRIGEIEKADDIIADVLKMRTSDGSITLYGYYALKGDVKNACTELEMSLKKYEDFTAIKAIIERIETDRYSSYTLIKDDPIWIETLDKWKNKCQSNEP